MTAIEPDRAGAGERGSRPHVWPCRHCDMVTDYHLLRESQRQQAEGVFRQDEDYRLTTFKQWLQAFEWDTRQQRHEQDAADRAAHHRGTVGPDDGADGDGTDPWAAHWSARWAGTEDSATADGGSAVPASRTGDHDTAPPATGDQAEGRALGVVAEEVDRAGQLQRWHTDDHPTADNADTADESSADALEGSR